MSRLIQIPKAVCMTSRSTCDVCVAQIVTLRVYSVHATKHMKGFLCAHMQARLLYTACVPFPLCSCSLKMELLIILTCYICVLGRHWWRINQRPLILLHPPRTPPAPAGFCVDFGVVVATWPGGSDSSDALRWHTLYCRGRGLCSSN